MSIVYQGLWILFVAALDSSHDMFPNFIGSRWRYVSASPQLLQFGLPYPFWITFNKIFDTETIYNWLFLPCLKQPSVPPIALGRQCKCPHLCNSLCGLIPASSSGCVFWHHSLYPYYSISLFLFHTLLKILLSQGKFLYSLSQISLLYVPRIMCEFLADYHLVITPLFG